MAQQSVTEAVAIKIKQRIGAHDCFSCFTCNQGLAFLQQRLLQESLGHRDTADVFAEVERIKQSAMNESTLPPEFLNDDSSTAPMNIGS